MFTVIAFIWKKFDCQRFPMNFEDHQSSAKTFEHFWKCSKVLIIIGKPNTLQPAKGNNV